MNKTKVRKILLVFKKALMTLREGGKEEREGKEKRKKSEDRFLKPIFKNLDLSFFLAYIYTSSNIFVFSIILFSYLHLHFRQF